MLNGMSLERAELMGKPHIKSKDGMCVICGLHKATNKHHLVPKGIGAGSKYGTIYSNGISVKVESPLIDVCGMGNASGCHKLLHEGLIEIEWVWDDERFYKDWWTCKMVELVGNPGLYNFGHYKISRSKDE